MRPELSLVIPIYNEEQVLPQLDARLKELLDRIGVDTEVIFVNDGSKDGSIDLLRRMASHELRYRVLGFSRNFGHQRAISAGMDKSRGRAVVVMDADLQDPPEVILEMLEKWRAGYDVVYGRRRSRDGESWFKLVTAKIFYRLFASLIPIEVPLDTGDFRLMSRRVVTTMRGLRESHRFVRGLVAWVGFKQTAVAYDRAARAAGETKYPLRKMLAFAIDGIASFSIQPLRFATYVGVFVGAASVVYSIAAIVSYYVGITIPGWTTTVVLVSFLFAVQFFMIGVLGEYVGRIYEQVKRRPLYIVSERINFGRKAERLLTQDLEELATPVLPVAAPPPASPSTVAKKPSRMPPIPGTSKPVAPPLSSSVANMHVGPLTGKPGSEGAPPSKESPTIPPPKFGSVPPKFPSTAPPKFGSVPPPAATPGSPPVKAFPATTPNAAAVKASPSTPPIKAAPTKLSASSSDAAMKTTAKAAPASGRTSTRPPDASKPIPAPAKATSKDEAPAPAPKSDDEKG